MLKQNHTNEAVLKGAQTVLPFPVFYFFLQQSVVVQRQDS